MTDKTVHKPVLLQEILDNLQPKFGQVVLDATLGGGGHALAIAKRIGNDGTLIGIDTDAEAIIRAKETLSNVSSKLYLVKDNFRNLDKVLNDIGIDFVDLILFDLGFSSDQIELSGRGFSFQREEPLYMTLDNEHDNVSFTAHDIVNDWDEEYIADIIYWYGEERFARKIAKAIIEARKESAIDTTTQLAEIIEHAIGRRGKIHPATKTFQALRIAVNDELDSIKIGLNKALEHLNHNGRIAVISFHSLEDRIVKHMFKDWQTKGLGNVLMKKPICPTKEEIQENKRARSSKLRVFEKK